MRVPDSGWRQFASEDAPTPIEAFFRYINTSFTCTGNLTHPLPDGGRRQNALCALTTFATCCDTTSLLFCAVPCCAVQAEGRCTLAGPAASHVLGLPNSGLLCWHAVLARCAADVPCGRCPAFALPPAQTPLCALHTLTNTRTPPSPHCLP